MRLQALQLRCYIQNTRVAALEQALNGDSEMHADETEGKMNVSKGALAQAIKAAQAEAPDELVEPDDDAYDAYDASRPPTVMRPRRQVRYEYRDARSGRSSKERADEHADERKDATQRSRGTRARGGDSSGTPEPWPEQ